MQSDATLRRWYRRYNERYFAGELPDDVLLWWEPGGTALAWTTQIEVDPPQYAITVDPSLVGMNRIAKLTLLHEMIHIQLAGKRRLASHGKCFDRELQRLLQIPSVRKLI